MRVVDLFCGCGGLSLGFQNAGFDIVAAYDKWEPAIEIYKKNFGHPIFNVDLSTDEAITHIANQAPDMIIGGPPCQDFSIAGKREQGERANLTRQYAKIVSAIKPQVFVMENVYNIVRMPILQEAIDILHSAGYGLSKCVLDASYCGVPQTRKRFIMIGIMGGKDDDLLPDLLGGQSKKQLTVREYLGNSLNTDFYYMHPRSYNRRAVFSVDEPSSTIRGVNRPIPAQYKKHPADVANIDDGVRSLTSLERSFIQTFPSTFKWVGTKSQIEQAIGNAVPVKLAEYVANIIKKNLREDDNGL